MKVLIDGINYELNFNAHTAFVCHLDGKQQYDGDIVIPSAVTYNGTAYRITGIEDFVFDEDTNLTSITIPNSVADLGIGAFSGCTGLTSIAIPDSVTSIAMSAFSGCTSLTSITIPDSVTSIESCAFEGCIGLTSITIPDSVTSIESCAFDGCISLTSITIPDSVTSIGLCAFDDTPWLDNQPNGEIYIHTILYGYKGDMPIGSSIVVREGTTSIGGRAFKDCAGLTSITIPDSVTSIGDYAFHGCTSLTSIAIPDSVTSIGCNAFEGCEALVSIRIPKGNRSIFCAEDLKELQDKIIEYIPAQINGMQYELDSDLTAIVCARAEKYAGEVVVPMRVEQEEKTYTVNRLGERAFADCYELTAVTLPKSITEIGTEEFSGCENLQTIRVTQGMKEWLCERGLEPYRKLIVEIK